MMKIIYDYKFLALVFIVTILFSGFFGCSSLQHFDDAIRIKQDSAKKYNFNPFNNAIRNGSTLRGTVVKVQVITFPDTCPANLTKGFKTKTEVVFLDSLSTNDKQLEYIPMEDIEFVGQQTSLPINEYNNINLFENFNNPEGIRNIREVPVDSSKINTCSPCNCESFDIAFKLPYLTMDCPKRNYSWYFAELRGAYSVYTDIKTLLKTGGRDIFFGELATGFRFGGAKEWGLGLAYSYPIKTYNSNTEEDVSRHLVLLHGRYQSPNERFLGICMKPFVYGQFGISIDKFSIDLFKINFNTECKNRIAAYLPYIDVSLPISYGIGAGLDIPVASFMDISFDLGYRSIAFGEETSIASYILPSTRRIYMLVFRFGVTF